MNNRLMPVSEGETVEYLDYGHHKHAYVIDKTKQAVFIGVVDGEKVMKARRGVERACGLCEAENDAFLTLQKTMGSQPLEDRMYSLPSYKAYNQRWPFDAREKVLSTEAVFEERADGQSTEPASNDVSIMERLLDDEATDEILSVLPEEHRMVIERTVEGYKPREIAEMNGQKNSARVRQVKYSAMRELGAPIKSNMRRSRHGERED